MSEFASSCSQLEMLAVINKAYEETRQEFKKWTIDPKCVSYVCPPATSPDEGFTIFYTPVVYRPKLLIVGQNPANFSGGFRPALEDTPNRMMLSGIIPSENTYLTHNHSFARRLREAFLNDEHLLKDAVGMNVWHYQAVLDASKAPFVLRRFCETTTRHIISVINPIVIICIGSHAFNAIPGNRSEILNLARDVRQFDTNATRVIGLPHITGSYSWEACSKAMPVVIAALRSYLTAPK